MKFKFLIIILLFTTILYSLQSNNSNNNPNLDSIALSGSTIDWLYFSQPVNTTEISPLNYLESIKQNLGLTTNDSFVLRKTFIDEQGDKHHRFNQYYKGIKVEGCDYILHEIEGEYLYANGKLGIGLNKSIATTISKDSARNIALSYINSNTWGRQVYEIDTV